ncbi:hypothetical protein TNCT_67581 [Trichonephila clavata]|uniref:Uncharacterized protein n=1 Tax=Trichonephila clavata TaxID=2740835 RepID=A0A8X6H6W7_TRICU|nr:hypothetical protein TNCT_67581 [Trichonephila clavata]
MDEKKPGKLFLDFAGDAVLMSLQGSNVPDELHKKLERLQVPEHVRAVEESMSNLYIIFRKEFDEILYTNQNLIFDTGRKCTTFILCRCLSICKQPSYLSLIVAGSFLYALVFFWLRRKDCYHILKLCVFSLLAVYRRSFKNMLKSERNYDSLFSFLVELNESVTPKIEADELKEAFTALKDHGKNAHEYIEQCKTAEESIFIFTEFEYQFLKKEFKKQYDEEKDDEASVESSLIENVSEEGNISDFQTEGSDMNKSFDSDADDIPATKSIDSSKKVKKSSSSAKKGEMKRSDNPVEKNTERNSPQQGSSKYFDELEIETSVNIGKKEKRKSAYNPRKGKNKQSEGSKKGKSTKSKSPEQGTSKHFDELEQAKKSAYLRGNPRKTPMYSKRSSKKPEAYPTSESDVDDPEAEVLSAIGSSESDVDDPESIQCSSTDNRDNETEETSENIEEILISEGIDIYSLLSDSENPDCKFCSTRCSTFLNRLNNFDQSEKI